MNLFPMNQPTLALSISEEALFLVQVKKSWRKTTLQEVKKVSLPPGVIRLSSAKPNIENKKVFIERLHSLTESLKAPISIALSLPDLCARTSVFDFSKFPTKKNEQVTLLNWRFQQDLKLDTAQSRLAYGIYIPTSVTNDSTQEPPEAVRILGTAIRNEVVEQFESACLDARLIPASVSISGLDIFDFYQNNIEKILETEDRRSPNTSSGGMFLFMSHWGFTFFAFEDGCPIFVRTKAISIRPTDTHQNEHALASDQERLSQAPPSDTQVSPSMAEYDRERVLSPYPSYTTTKVEKEVLATLQYYLEVYSQNRGTPSPTNLFFVTDLEHGHMLLPSAEHIQQTAKVSGLTSAPIQVTQFSYMTHVNTKNCRSLQESDIWSALPGYASLRVA